MSNEKCSYWLALFITLIAPVGATHTSIGSMLKDAAVNHDLEKEKLHLLRAQRRVDSDDRRRISGKDDLIYHALDAKPVISR